MNISRTAVAALLLGLVVGMAGALHAATTPKIVPTKRTGKVKLSLQSFTAARHDSLSVTAALLNAQAQDGNKALQVKDDPTTDIACAVKLQLSGPMGVFSDTGTFTFDVIDSPEEFLGLKSHVSELVKIVLAIRTCGGLAGTYAGCTIPGHIAMISTPSDPLTLVHEFGHHKGLNLVIPDTNPKRIMFDGAVSGKEVTRDQCDAYKR